MHENLISLIVNGVLFFTGSADETNLDTELIRKSITANNYEVGHGLPLAWMLNSSTVGRTGLPRYWSPTRDYYLREILYSEYHDFWAGAIGIAITKISSLAWEIEGTQPRIRNYFQQMYLNTDGGQSWVSFIARHLSDFLCTDNGAFVEIVRTSSAAGSRILGLMHLDSLRCTRTGEEEIPIIYRDLKGIEHEVAAHQVLMLSDMPASAASLHGVGLCATSRAWTAIRKMEAIERYIYEKVSGDRALALDIVKGIAPRHIQESVESAREDKEERLSNRSSINGDTSPGNAFLYLGSVVVPVLDDTKLEHVRINFAELPDGFDRQKEFDIAVLQMANSIGLDVQDLQPLTGRPLGTAMQSEVLEEKSKGKGLAAWRQQWMHLHNQLVLPTTITFAFSENDLRDKEMLARVFNSEADAVSKTIAGGMITPAQGAQIMADADFIPAEFVPEDTTPQEAIADTEKPGAETQAQDEAETPPEPTVTTKELRERFADALGRFNQAIQ